MRSIQGHLFEQSAITASVDQALHATATSQVPNGLDQCLLPEVDSDGTELLGQFQFSFLHISHNHLALKATHIAKILRKQEARWT